MTPQVPVQEQPSVAPSPPQAVPPTAEGQPTTPRTTPPQLSPQPLVTQPSPAYPPYPYPPPGQPYLPPGAPDLTRLERGRLNGMFWVALLSLGAFIALASIARDAVVSFGGGLVLQLQLVA